VTLGTSCVKDTKIKNTSLWRLRIDNMIRSSDELQRKLYERKLEAGFAGLKGRPRCKQVVGTPEFYSRVPTSTRT